MYIHVYTIGDFLMGVIETKTFKSGNSVAVRLPKVVELEAGAPIRITYGPRSITITPIEDPAAGKKRVADFIAAMRALPKPPYIEEREPIEFPDRPGL
jgi:antitoxin VapB